MQPYHVTQVAKLAQNDLYCPTLLFLEVLGPASDLFFFSKKKKKNCVVVYYKMNGFHSFSGYDFDLCPSMMGLLKPHPCYCQEDIKFPRNLTTTWFYGAMSMMFSFVTSGSKSITRACCLTSITPSGCAGNKYATSTPLGAPP